MTAYRNARALREPLRSFSNAVNGVRMQLKIVAFAQAADLLGFRERTVDCESDETPRSLFARLASNADLQVMRVAIDREYRSWDEPLGAARELALIPPVSGG